MSILGRIAQGNNNAGKLGQGILSGLDIRRQRQVEAARGALATGQPYQPPRSLLGGFGGVPGMTPGINPNAPDPRTTMQSGGSEEALGVLARYAPQEYQQRVQASQRAAEAEQAQFRESMSTYAPEFVRHGTAMESMAPPDRLAYFQTQVAPGLEAIGMGGVARQVIADGNIDDADVQALISAGSAFGGRPQGDQGPQTVGSPQKLANGNLGLVMSDGTVTDTGVSFDRRPRTLTIGKTTYEEQFDGDGASRFVPIRPAGDVIEEEAAAAGATAGARTRATQEAEAEAVAPLAIIQADEKLREADRLIQDIDAIIPEVDWYETGMTGAILRNLPGTSAFDLDRSVDAIKANLGFDELQKMRDMSPTGGALGQVSNRELNLLTSAIRSLDTAQSREQLLRNFIAVRDHYKNWRDIVSAQREQAQSQMPEQPDDGFRLIRSERAQ